MLTVLRIILAIIVILIAGSGLIIKNYDLQPYMIFFLSSMMLVMGLEEFQKGQKSYGWIFMVVFIFLLFVSISKLLFS